MHSRMVRCPCQIALGVLRATGEERHLAPYGIARFVHYLACGSALGGSTDGKTELTQRTEDRQLDRGGKARLRRVALELTLTAVQVL
ncbi:unnamed protein product [marine sediment metagenome]|uniref:Uncharacterized protein n=1 Tax=marine sediment metagenome TaxID=412755 RepID=X0WM96_9ZZZZ